MSRDVGSQPLLPTLPRQAEHRVLLNSDDSLVGPLPRFCSVEVTMRLGGFERAGLGRSDQFLGATNFRGDAIEIAVERVVKQNALLQRDSA